MLYVEGAGYALNRVWVAGDLDLTTKVNSVS